MNEFELIFAIFFKPTDSAHFFNQDEHRNLIFHKWVPNGEIDSINLFSGDEDISIKVWFERRIDNDGSYSVDFEEIGDSSLSKILKIESGPMVVKICAQNLTIEQINAFKNPLWFDFCQNFNFSELTPCRNRNKLTDSMGSEQNLIYFQKFLQTEEFKIIYEFAKNLAKRFYRPLSNLIQFIKYNFGQYWISDFAHFDSRKGNLGAYFVDLCAQWRFKGSKKWIKFILEPPLWDFWAPKVDKEVYSRFITKTDWEKLKKIKIHDFSLKYPLKRLIDAHRQWELKNYNEAFIYLCNALDLSIDFYFDELRSDFSSSIQSFRSLPWINKLPLITSNLLKNGSISKEDLQKGLDAITIRNKIVHEDFSLNDSVDISRYEELYNGLKIIIQLLIENQPKFPIYEI